MPEDDPIFVVFNPHSGRGRGAQFVAPVLDALQGAGGVGHALTAGPGDEGERRVRDLAETIQLASLCGLGQAAPLALLRALETFPEAFRDGG